jgi:tyrosinase
MENVNNRRDFLKIAGITAISPYLLGNSELNALAPAPLFVRKDVATLGISDPILVSYRTAVAAMKALPASDPRNWTNVANIHQNGCPHGNWFFLPWHRAYLYYFERLIRQFSGNNNFALPYWNWTVNPQIPAAFWQNDSLHDTNRDITPTSTIDPEFVGPTVMADIMNLSIFTTFGSGQASTLRGSGSTGQLESTPHNNVHVFVGGDMVTFMSPLDPIFWLHHANIDRVWAMWNDSGKRNTNNPAWRTFDLAPAMGTKFVNFDKTLINSALVSKFTSTRALNYRYDTQSAATALFANSVSTQFLSAKTISFITPSQSEITTSEPLQVDMTTSPEFVQKSAKVVRKKGKVEEDIVVLNIALKKPIPENALVKVFINKPDITKDTPIDDPHYVSSFCFFATNHGDHAMDMQDHANHDEHTSDTISYVFELNKTLDKLNRMESSLKENISVHLLVSSSDTTKTFKLKPDSFKVSVLKRA